MPNHATSRQLVEIQRNLPMLVPVPLLLATTIFLNVTYHVIILESDAQPIHQQGRKSQFQTVNTSLNTDQKRRPGMAFGV